MKKELIKLQTRNREINDRLGEIYAKAENEKRELNAEELAEERKLNRELEANHREIRLSGDQALIAGLREQQNKSAQLREYLKGVKNREFEATTVLLNADTANGNTVKNIAESGAVPVTIHDVMDTQVEGIGLPQGLNILTGVVGDNLWPLSTDDVVVSVAGEVEKVEEQALSFANIKAVSERLTAAVAVSNKAIDNAAFDLFTFVTAKIRKGLAIKLAKRVYSHAAWNDNFKGPFSLVDAATIQKGNDFAKNLAIEVAKIADLGFEGEPTIVIDKVTEAELKYTPLIAGDPASGTVIKDGKLAGYNYVTSGHINGELNGDGEYVKSADRYVGIGFFEYYALQQHGEVRFTVDGISAAVAARNSTVFTLNTDFSGTELSQKVNGNKSGKPQAFKLLKIVAT